MTLEQIQTEIRFRLGGARRSDLTSGDGLTALNNWIDFAYREICHTFTFPALERLDTSTTTNTTNAYVTIPANVYAVTFVYDVTNATRILPLPGGWEEYERLNVLSSTTGEPTNWTRRANLIYFKPRPNGAYNMRLSVIDEPSAIASGQEPVIPEIWHKAIVYRAVAEGWGALGESDRQTASMTEFRNHIGLIRQQRAIESRTRRQRGIRVRHAARNPRLGV